MHHNLHTPMLKDTTLRRCTIDADLQLTDRSLTLAIADFQGPTVAIPLVTPPITTIQSSVPQFPH